MMAELNLSGESFDNGEGETVGEKDGEGLGNERGRRGLGEVPRVGPMIAVEYP